MRLAILDSGHRWRQRLALRVMRIAGRTDPDPVAKVALYRPELFGRAWMHFIEPVMRGRSEWSNGDRELIGAFISRLNDCPFCVGVHSGIAESYLPSAVTDDRLDRWREGEFGPRLTAAFELLDKLAAAPGSVGGDDIGAARAAGLSDTAIRDALYIGFLFNVVNRLANAFDFRWDTDARRRKLAAGLDRIGYHVPELLLR